MQKIVKHAFIDESGDDSIQVDKDGVSSHYVAAAIVVDGDRYGKIASHFDNVRKLHFQQAKEMKSEHIGNNDERRERVIKALLQEEHSIYILVVEKERLTGPGFSYAKSFVKFSLDRLVGEILKDFANAKILCDEIKGPKFQEEFKRYIVGKHPQDLFRTWQFDFASSLSNICIQASDIFAGTVARCWERTKKAPENDQFMQLMKSHIGFFRIFPDRREEYTTEQEGMASSEFDYAIERRAVFEAEEYIKRYQNSDKLEHKARVEILHLLLSHNYLQSDNNWIATEVLMNLYKERFGEEVSEQKLRGIIGNLRDADVLIASRHAGGYRLPTCRKDLEEFLNVQNTQIEPMLRRIRKARETVMRATDDNVDILDKSAYKNLKDAVESLPSWKANYDESEQ